jgi:hypothetical protein
MKAYYLWWSAININAWLWSAVFHTRGQFLSSSPSGSKKTNDRRSDLPFTEKMDYFSAASAILFGLYYSVVRLFHIYPLTPRECMVLPEYQPERARILRLLWSAFCILLFLGHITYLSILPRFDYTYNIIFNLALGLTYNALWLVYSLPSSLSLMQRFPSRPKSYRPAFATQPAILVVLAMMAMSFELCDFPPWRRIIDAHALWHLSTAPLVAFLYEFTIQDALDEGWLGHKA